MVNASCPENCWYFRSDAVKRCDSPQATNECNGKDLFGICRSREMAVMGYKISMRYQVLLHIISNPGPNLQQKLQRRLVSPKRLRVDANKRRTTIYKGARRPAMADVP
ncbi:Uncharacterized protein FWK35_00029501 [Aphis craccivora]|uniref:Uncharacterized protein n=1 Tax=Aphis craccivora TaxID=307492 RepID=A0A6G0Z3U5_APHCR|nr:Uncharacterized protein FWK35_00029501 [Aphis craccivora]